MSLGTKAGLTCAGGQGDRGSPGVAERREEGGKIGKESTGKGRGKGKERHLRWLTQSESDFYFSQQAQGGKRRVFGGVRE